MTAAARPHRVVVLLLAPVIGFDAAIPPQLFGSAVNDRGEALYEVITAGLTRGPVAGASGYDIVAGADLSALAGADTVIVPGTRIEGPRQAGTLPDEVRAALALIRPGTRIVSICTGAFVLAAAGLLNGRPATTHWEYTADFRRLYPEVELYEDMLFVDDGELLTSAGLAAGIDLCLHIIRRDHGAVVANRVAKHCVVAPWRNGGQAQFIEHPVPTPDAQSTSPAREWALRNLDQAVAVEQLAQLARMSVRTFNRRFREETGSSPGAWLIERRVDRARDLLESTDLPVDDVAARAGLGTGSSLRQQLRAHIGVSPTEYRRTFRG
jgi:transcriptional regulator GlxA family with amidase domain